MFCFRALGAENVGALCGHQESRTNGLFGFEPHMNCDHSLDRHVDSYLDVVYVQTDDVIQRFETHPLGQATSCTTFIPRCMRID